MRLPISVDAVEVTLIGLVLGSFAIAPVPAPYDAAPNSLLIKQGNSAVSPAAPSLDLWAEAVLDPAIAPSSPSSSIDSIPAPNNILLTGATGFLGAFLLHELLEQTQATVYCLVRGSNANEAQQRGAFN